MLSLFIVLQAAIAIKTINKTSYPINMVVLRQDQHFFFISYQSRDLSLIIIITKYESYRKKIIRTNSTMILCYYLLMIEFLMTSGMYYNIDFLLRSFIKVRFEIAPRIISMITCIRLYKCGYCYFFLFQK